MNEIPLLDIGPLFGAPSAARRTADLALMAAAADCGFLIVVGLPPQVPAGAAARTELLRVFQLPAAQLRKLWRQKFEPAHRNVYRGWFPLQAGHPTRKEGIDLGADVAYGAGLVHPRDPLREATPLPDPQALPGWQESIGTYYRAMEAVSRALMHAIARGLGLQEDYFDAHFDRGLSTLRLIRYPQPEGGLEAGGSPAEFMVTHDGEQRRIIGAPHVDSGFLTLLAQDGVSGLQARRRGGAWLDVPPVDRGLAVNFGRVLERWSGGRILATEHRVIDTGRERMSIPFFYEARAEASIAPLPLPGIKPFEPFLYGNYLWATTTKFVEFAGMEALRTPLIE